MILLDGDGSYKTFSTFVFLSVQDLQDLQEMYFQTQCFVFSASYVQRMKGDITVGYIIL